MLRSFEKRPEHVQARDRVKAWTRARFKLCEDTAILVAEVSCAVPGCPPLETVVAFWTDSETRHQFKVFKPVREVVEEDLPLFEVEATHLSEHDASVRLPPEHRAQRCSHLGCRERSGRHLVGERLEKVEVLPVHERDVDRSTVELAHRLQAAEASADDDNPVTGGLTRRRRHQRSTSPGPRTSAASTSVLLRI